MELSPLTPSLVKMCLTCAGEVTGSILLPWLYVLRLNLIGFCLWTPFLGKGEVSPSATSAPASTLADIVKVFKGGHPMHFCQFKFQASVNLLFLVSIIQELCLQSTCRIAQISQILVVLHVISLAANILLVHKHSSKWSHRLYTCKCSFSHCT